MLALLAVGVTLLATLGCDKLRARDQLNKGVAAYKNAKYEEAIDKFQNAVSLDPTLLNARLYLATAYAQQYIPGADTPDNNKMGEQAISEYKDVLNRDPKNINSIKGIAYIYLNMKKFEDAKSYYRKALEADPNDPEPYYSVGVIDWTQSYQPRMEERAKLGLKPEENLSPKNKDQKKVCDDLKAKNSANIQDGIDNLKKALDLRPDYDDAMAYMNLLIRERADLDESPDQYKKDIETADGWVQKALDTKKMKAAKEAAKTAGGITQETPK